VSEALLLWNAPELAVVRSRLAFDVNGYVIATNPEEAPPCALELPKQSPIETTRVRW
jgi:hypothetical protein